MTIDIIGATAGRTAEVWHAYQAYRRTVGDDCPFCGTHREINDAVVHEVGSMLVLRNRFPYAVWDSAHVGDHLMIVPVRHVLSLDEYTDAEALDFFTLMRAYEAAGYSLYTRQPGNRGRSVGHVHTHLIKTGDFV